jgi:CDP-glucose 4,6-dehydratase
MANKPSTMEIMEMINTTFWQNKKVLVTGATGFKGSWLTIWLNMLGAKIYAYSLTSPTKPSMWDSMQLNKLCSDVNYSDIRNYEQLSKFINTTKPEIIIHMAAQPLVRDSYKNPRETYEVNVMGSVNLFEAVRQLNQSTIIINVTTDKCYDNKEWVWAYRENEPMGGHDPYSNSKGCSELVTSSYINSFFTSTSPIKLASARAGNVIGGGDFADERLIPDIIRSFTNKQIVNIRYPQAIRPWQHVLEPLFGYLTLAEKLYTDGHKYSGGWNFGPQEIKNKTVAQIVTQMCNLWGEGASWQQDTQLHPHEATYLRLDCAKAQMLLNWTPRWSIDTTINKLNDWYKGFFAKQDMLKFTQMQINDYMY